MATITNVMGSSLNTISIGSTGNTVTTTGLSTANSLTIGSLAGTSLAGSSNNFSFSVPMFTDGAVFPPYGNNTLTITDGSNPASITVDLTPPANYTSVTLTSVAGTGAGYIQSYIVGCAVGDTITFRTPTSLNVVTNQIGLDGKIQTDYFGSQTAYHRNGSTGTITVLTITTPGTADTTPDAFSFIALTNQSTSTTLQSNEIVITGVDIGQLIPISVTGGSYLVDSGSGYGVPTTVAGFVRSGYKVKAQVVSSASASAQTTATVTIGGVNGAFAVTTGVPIDTTPDAFSFTPVVDAVFSSVQTSSEITIAGVTAGVDIPISISGGTYAIDTGGGYGSYVSTSGNVRLGYKVRVRVTASASNATVTSATLTIGGVAGTFSVTSLDTVPNAFSFTPQTGVAISSTMTSDTITVAGVSAGQNIPISITDGTYSVNTGGGFGAYASAAGNVQLGHQVRVQLTSSAGYNTAATATLTIGGVQGTFSATTTAADTVPDVFGLVDLTNQTTGATIESNAIAVAGVSAGVDVPVSVTGGEYAINTGGGFGAWTSAAGNVRLGHSVKVRGVASTSYSTATNVNLTIGGVSDTFTITTIASSSVTVNTVNTGTVYGESNANTVATAGLASASSVTIDSIAMPGLSGSNNSYLFNVPALAADVAYPKFGNVNLTISDGVAFATKAITFLPKNTLDYITLTGTGGTGIGFIGNYITCAANDQIIFSKPATLSVTNNGVRDDGSIFTDYTGTQTMWHRRASNGLITQLTVTTPAQVQLDTTPDAFSFTAVTGQEYVADVISNPITVTGVTAATNVPISITGGSYSIDGGAYVSTAGNVQLNSVVRVKLTTSSAATTQTSATLTIGGVAGTFTATTRASDTTPNAFSFTAVSNATISTQYTATTTVAGVDAGIDIPISITGGSYAINSGSGFGAELTTPSVVRLGYTVRVTATSSSAGNSNVSASLTIGGVTGVFTVSTGTVVTTPTAFSFVPATGQEANATIDSGTVTITGVTAGIDIPVSISGGSYAVNSGSGFGAFTSSAGVVRLGNTIKVRGNASGSYSDTVSVTLTVGGVAGTFSISTRAADTTPNTYTFASVSNAALSSFVESAFITVAGVDAGVDVPISITNGQYAVDSGSGFGAYTSTNTQVRLGYKVKVRVQASASFNTPTSTTLTIGGVTGTFTAVSRLANTSPQAFSFVAATGVQVSTTAESNIYTVTGVDGGVDIAVSVANGQYAVDTGSGFGSFTNVSGIIRLGQSVKVRGTAASIAGVTNTVSLTIGGVTGTFAITSAAVDATPDSNVYSLNTTTFESNPVTITGADNGVDMPISITGSGAQYAVNSGSGFGAYTASTGTVRNGYQIKIRVDVPSSTTTSVTASVNIGGVVSTWLVNTSSGGVAVDTIPDNFSIASITGASPGVLTESASFSLVGFDAGVDIPVVPGSTLEWNRSRAGTWSGWSNAQGTTRMGDLLKVRLTSSITAGEVVQDIITIGGISSQFQVFTRFNVRTSPTPFTFVDYIDAPLAADVTSQYIVVAGVTGGIDIPISITGGSYAIDDGSGFGGWLTSPSNVRLGYRVKLKMTTSALVNTTTTAILAIDSVYGTWSVKTVAVADVTPDAFVFRDSNNITALAVVDSDENTITGVDNGVDIVLTVSGAQIAINTGSGYGSFTTPSGAVVLRKGHKFKLRAQALAGAGSLKISSVVVSGNRYTWTVRTAGSIAIAANYSADTLNAIPVSTSIPTAGALVADSLV